MNVLFFIPSYNDHVCLPVIISRLLTDFSQAKVFVVDDGSDQPITLSLSADLQKRFFVYRLESNLGLGLATGIAQDFFRR